MSAESLAKAMEPLAMPAELEEVVPLLMAS
jgi:hypothetical protein